MKTRQKSASLKPLVDFIAFVVWKLWPKNNKLYNYSRGQGSSTGGQERFSGSHEQRLLLNSSSVVLQNPIDEQGATSIKNLWKGATNHEKLRTTALAM